MSTIDEATAELIYQLQSEDIEKAKQNFKGKGKENDDLPDSELALQLQGQELEREARERADHRMAASIGRAVYEDGANIAIMAGEESRAADDRAIACRLGGQTTRPDSHNQPAAGPDDSPPNESMINIGTVDSRRVCWSVPKGCKYCHFSVDRNVRAPCPAANSLTPDD